MVEITVELLRSKLSQLNVTDGYAQCHELSLHQYNITKLNKVIQQLLPNLHVLYLQNNYISTIEHIFKLKSLQYLNLAINNITQIPSNIGRLESLQKLDLTLNFIPLTNLHSSLLHLRPCIHLTEFTLLGNPCAIQYNEWYKSHNKQYNTNNDTNNRYRLYLITILCNNNNTEQCNVRRLDGYDITATERIIATQLQTELYSELQQCIEYYEQHPESNTTYTAEQRLADYEAQLKFDTDKQSDATALNNFIPPTNPIEQHKQQLKQKVIYDENEPLQIQRNTGKYTYNVDYSHVTRTGYMHLHIDIPVCIQLEQIEIDIQQQYIQCIIEQDNLLIHIQYDYLIATDRCKIQRITLTGELHIQLAIQQYIHLCEQNRNQNIVVDYSNVNNTLTQYKQAMQSVIKQAAVEQFAPNDTVQPVILKRVTTCRVASSTASTSTYVDDTDVPPLE